ARGATRRHRPRTARKANLMRPVPARVATATMPPALPALRRVAGGAGLAALAGAMVLTALAFLSTRPAGAAAGAGAAPSAQAEYDAALKMAGQQKGVHFESALSQGGVSIKV